MFPSELKTEEQISEAIIGVIVFFDLFDYPLSAYEIWKYLDKKTSLIIIVKSLENLKIIGKKNGLFFLAGREEIIDIRQKRHNYSLRKIKIANRFSKLFSLLPYVKTVILSNSIGLYNLRDGSDIDFFIISSANRIWLTRLYCAGVAALLNSRPSFKNKRDKICLSFYISTENLNLDNLKLVGGDPYFYYWLRSFILLYNKDKTYEDFLSANCLERSPDSYVPGTLEIDRKKEFKISRSFENIAKKIQFLIMSPALKRAINNSVGVVINDKVLKLYLTDNRQDYREKYGNKIKQVLAQD
ncbi:MAG: hypothetical protein ACOYL8_01940 [Patescibacteria group bacterium]